MRRVQKFKLRLRPNRITAGALFDPMMAVINVRTWSRSPPDWPSNESMLTSQPLRYVLATNPRAGKTSWPGCFIRELLMRAECPARVDRRPGSLIEQCKKEMFEKFGPGPFHPRSQRGWSSNRAVAILLRTIICCGTPSDQLARNEDLQSQKLRLTRWD